MGWTLTPLVDAARTPPLFSGRRVVVGRHLARFARAEAHAALLDLLADMLPTTDLLLVWEQGQQPAVSGRLPPVPKKLAAAVRAAGGEVVKPDAPFGKRDGSAWLQARIGASGLRFDRAATTALQKLIGQDRSRVVECLRTLEGALGPGAAVTADDRGRVRRAPPVRPCPGTSMTPSTAATPELPSRCCTASYPRAIRSNC